MAIKEKHKYHFDSMKWLTYLTVMDIDPEIKDYAISTAAQDIFYTLFTRLILR